MRTTRKTQKNRLLRSLTAGASVLVLIAAGTAWATEQDRQTQPEQAQVQSVYDGDTFTVVVDGQREHVRILGIDAPELSPSQCYAKQSRDLARQLLISQTVVLQADDAQGNGDRHTDRYGRLLRYVELETGADLAQELLAQGAAKTYDQYPVERTALYQQTQRDARNTQRGQWAAVADGGCDE